MQASQVRSTASRAGQQRDQPKNDRAARWTGMALKDNLPMKTGDEKLPSDVN